MIFKVVLDVNISFHLPSVSNQSIWSIFQTCVYIYIHIAHILLGYAMVVSFETVNQVGLDDKIFCVCMCVCFFRTTCIP